MWRQTLRENRAIVSTLWGLLAVLGLMLALVGARIQGPEETPGEALVWVNERPVTARQLNHAAQRLSAAGGAELSEAEYDSLLKLLVDEELLLQRAEGLGVLQSDPGVRKAIVRSAINEIVEEFLAQPPDQRQLEQFYRHHSAVFERPARLAVTALRFDQQADAQAARELVAIGGSWAELAAGPGAEPLWQLPDFPLPAHMLRRYLGPAAVDLALSLAPGEISPPVESSGGVYLLRALSVVPATVPEYQEVVPAVRQEFLARGRETALAEKLAWLWGEADVQFNPRVAMEHPAEHVGIQ